MEADNENPCRVNRQSISTRSLTEDEEIVQGSRRAKSLLNNHASSCFTSQILSNLFRFDVDGVHKTNIVEWNKKRKLQNDQLDLLRPKHKCWVQSFSSEHTSMFDDNLEFERMHNHMAKGKIDAAFLDVRSSPESAKDSNSFAEDSDTPMLLNEEVKLEEDCAETFLYGRPSPSSVNWDGYNVKDKHFSLDVSLVEKKFLCEVDIFADSEYNQSYYDADIQALQNLEEQLLELGNDTDHLYSKYAKNSSEQPIDKEFQDILHSNGVNPNMFILSSGRWEVNQEAESSTRPPTIDQEFEQYFSMLML